MRLLGLTPWRIFLIFWAAFCVTVVSSLFGYHWANVAMAVFAWVLRGVAVVAVVGFVAAVICQKRQERKGGDAR